MKNLFKKKSAPEELPIEDFSIEEQNEEITPAETGMEATPPGDTPPTGSSTHGEATSESLPKCDDTAEANPSGDTSSTEGERETKALEEREKALEAREKAIEEREKALEAERNAFEELTAASDGVPALGGSAAGEDRRRPSTIFDLAGFAR